MAKINIASIYPSSLSMARMRYVRTNMLAMVLKQAVNELGRVDHKRMLHVQGVAAAVEALENGDAELFINGLPEKIKIADAQRLGKQPQDYRDEYIQSLCAFFLAYKGLSTWQKSIIKLAALAHDLGVPYGIEWMHNINGVEVLKQLIQDCEARQDLMPLVYHHGQFSNLISTSFPRDIYALPNEWIKALLLFDVCDATARIGADLNLNNPVALSSLRLYQQCLNPDFLKELEDPDKQFKLRWQYGFAPLVFNRSMPDEAGQALKAEAEALGNGSYEKLVDFYGGKLRVPMLDLLLLAFNTPEDKAKLLATIFRKYAEAGIQGDVLLWPDIDLGREIGKDRQGFINRVQAAVAQDGVDSLFSVSADGPRELSDNFILFLASKLY